MGKGGQQIFIESLQWAGLFVLRIDQNIKQIAHAVRRRAKKKPAF